LNVITITLKVASFMLAPCVAGDSWLWHIDLWPAYPLGHKPPPRTVGQMTALAKVKTNASEIDQPAGAIELNDTPGVASPQADPER
jgi:hypothetical protein